LVEQPDRRPIEVRYRRYCAVGDRVGEAKTTPTGRILKSSDE
jgi:hypothetical protein